MARRKLTRNGGTTARDSVQVHGFFRVQVSEERGDGVKVVVGDSGWRKNQVVNLGFDQYLCQTLAGAAGSKTVSHMALGTGGAPAATDTSLAGEVTHATDSRKSVSTSTIASKTVQFTAAFNSAASWITANVNISNIGLFNVSQTSSGTIFAGNTYTSSTVATNQNVNATYQIRFS